MANTTTKTKNEVELQLMDYKSKKHPVKIEEGSMVVINIISGDHVMIMPKDFDCGDFCGGRIMGYFDGTVTFKATKENVEKFNSMQRNYDIFALDGKVK